MPTDQERLAALVEWLDRWRAAHTAFLQWIDEEYARRLHAFVRAREKARVKLAREAGRLETDPEGRVKDWTRKGDSKKWKFRDKTDAILVDVVEAGEELFGVAGKRDRAGIFIGDMRRQLRRAALKKLQEAMRKA